MTPVRPLVEAQGLTVTFLTPSGQVQAVNRVSFNAGRERLGIVGESGSGKSTICRALLGLLPPRVRVSADVLNFDGQSLLQLTPRDWRAIRGARIGLIMQDPKFSLNPVMSVGAQVAEVYRFRKGFGRVAAWTKAVAALAAVGIHEPESVARLYPHEVSGGMGQRVMIAAMLALDPDLLIADEATSALDATIATQVLALIDGLVVRRGMGLILISHDLGLVGRFCDRVLVMRSGQVVETLGARSLDNARHPYTRALLAARPRLDCAMDVLPTVQRDIARPK
jgi:peptide/nickel transport system ATP-binding protein